MLCITTSKFSLYSVGWGKGSGRGREIKLHFSWRGEQTLFGILLYGMSSPFVYLFNHLFILVWTLVYLGCNPIPHYLFYYSKFSSVGSYVPSMCPHPLIYCFSASLLSGTKRCPSPRISHFSEKVQSFYWRMGFRNQALGTYGFPHSSAGKKIHLQCRRPQFDSWVRKIPWQRNRLPTPVFWPGESHGLCIPWGCKEWDMTERFSLSLFQAHVCCCCFGGWSAGLSLPQTLLPWSLPSPNPTTQHHCRCTAPS